MFFARYEASQYGSPDIETEHIFLGLLREDKALTNRFLRSLSSVESIRKQIDAHTTIREKISTSVDLPLSADRKRVLNYAAEEAERLGHKHIGTEHLLLGLLREDTCFAAEILKERGVNLGTIREELAKASSESALSTSLQASLSDYFQDLTQAAVEGELALVIARDLEIDALIEVLAARQHRNPLLVGERGVGKRAIVEALAQRIPGGPVPQFLAEKRVIAFEPQPIEVSPKEFTGFLTELRKTLCTLVETSNVILVVRDFRVSRASGVLIGSQAALDILRPGIVQGRIQCIGVSTPAEFREFAQSVRWLGDLFRALHVRPLSEADTLAVLRSRKVGLERFHQASFDDLALDLAARSASRYLPDHALPGKAIELLDAAAARVKVHQPPLPEAILEVQRRIHLIVQRQDSAIANHEFEKARFYSEEERKERDNLRVLREGHDIDDAVPNTVRAEDVEAVIARWSEYPFQP